MKNLEKNHFDYFDEENLILIDGSGYIFRAYYALPEMSNPRGIPINAVFGFTNMIIKLLDDLKPKHVAVAFDVSRETFRNEIYKDYKSNRVDPPDDLIPQFDLIKKATQAIGLPLLELKGFEADDLIATYSIFAKKNKKNVVIISSDKDLMQLVNNQTVMFDPMKHKWIDDKAVFDKFGVYPDKVIDVQSLAGDASDNVPGVPGIGLKIAAELINEYGNLDNLLLKSDEVRQNKRRENLKIYKDQALISKKLVTLNKAVPIDLDLKSLNVKIELKNENFINFVKEHDFKKLIQRLEKSVNNQNKDKESIINKDDFQFTNRTKNYQLILTENDLDKFLSNCKSKNIISVDCETDSLNCMSANLVGISISYDKGEACYIPLRHGLNFEKNDLLTLDDDTTFPDQIEFNKAITKLKAIFEDKSILKVGHNIKFDALIMKQSKNGSINLNPLGDTMCMSYVLNLGKIINHKLDTVSLEELGYETIKFEEVCGKGVNQKTFDQINPNDALEYAAEDADVSLAIYRSLFSRLISEKKYFLYEKLERSLISTLINIENQGIIVNPTSLKKISSELGIKILELEEKIFKITETNFNVGSPKQLGEILFEKLKIEGGKKSKNGSWQTSVGILNELALKGFQIANYVLDWRHFSKLKNTYSEALLMQINEKTNRIHTNYSMVGTSTGRLSSSDPNLQNIPIRTEEGRLIRKAFEAKKNYLLLSMDYSQIELRLIAHISNEESMIQAFNDDVDIHSETACKVFNISPKNMNSDLRRKAKAINFGIIYGISPFGLAKQIQCSNGEAKEFIDSYFGRFPKIKEYMYNIKKQLYEDGFVETLFGRRIYFNSIDTKNKNLKLFAERQAINAPIQGSAADIMKLAMIKLNNHFQENKSDTAMLIQVHDELVFEVKENKVNDEIKIIKSIMESANIPIKELKVNLKVEYGFGKNWADAH